MSRFDWIRRMTGTENRYRHSLSTGQDRRLDLLFDDSDAAEIEPLLAAIRETGVLPGRPGAEPAPVIAVLITPALLEHYDEAGLAAATAGYQDVVPVSFLPGAAPVFEDLSQTLVRKIGPAEAARQIELTVQHGGGILVGWQRLADQAIKWRDESAGLLRAPDIAAALAIAHSDTALSSPHRRVVLDYVRTSEVAATKRRRLWSGVVSTAALLLAIVLIIAVTQAFSARRAQLAADLAANRADADRLSRAAISLIDADPDLPSILAAAAYDLAETDLANEARAGAAAKTWPHTSVPIDYQPQTITGARDVERFAVSEADQPVVHVQRIDGDGSVAEIARIEVETTKGHQVKGFLSPDGSRLATTEAAPGTLRLFDAVSGTPAKSGWVTGDDQLFGWLTNDRLLVGRGDRLLSMGLDGGAEIVLTALSGQVVDEAGISRNGRFVVAGTAESLIRVDLHRELPDRTAAVADAWEVAVNDSGTLAVAATNPLATTVDFAADPPEVSELGSFFGSSVAFLADQLVVSGQRDGVFAFFARDEHRAEWLEPATMRAHLAGSVRPATAGGTRLVTLGNDRYLRVWNIAEDAGARSYLSMASQAGISQASAREIAPRLSARNQIRFATPQDVVLAGRAGYATVLAADSLDEIEPPQRRRQREAGRCSDCAGIPGYFSSLESELLLSRNGRFLAAVGSKVVWISEHSSQSHYFDGPGQAKITATPPRATARGGEGVGAVADDGSVVLVADDSVVASLPAGGSMIDHEYREQRKPVGLFAGAPASLVVTADGYTRDATGTEQRLTLPAGTELAACELPALTDYLCVTTAGALLRITGTASTEIGAVGDGLRPFALRLSADQRRVAVLGRTGLSIVDLDSGTRQRVANRLPERMITDVAFSPEDDRILAVRTDGTAIVVDRPGTTAPPRALTEAETRRFAVPSGGR